MTVYNEKISLSIGDYGTEGSNENSNLVEEEASLCLEDIYLFNNNNILIEKNYDKENNIDIENSLLSINSNKRASLQNSIFMGDNIGADGDQELSFTNSIGFADSINFNCTNSFVVGENISSLTGSLENSFVIGENISFGNVSFKNCFFVSDGNLRTVSEGYKYVLSNGLKSSNNVPFETPGFTIEKESGKLNIGATPRNYILGKSEFENFVKDHNNYEDSGDGIEFNDVFIDNNKQVFGKENEAGITNGFFIGNENKGSANGSFIAGDKNNLSANNVFVIGSNNNIDNSSDNSFVIGSINAAVKNTLIIGNNVVSGSGVENFFFNPGGTINTTYSNMFVVKQGKDDLCTETRVKNNIKIFGKGLLATNNNEFAIGRYNAEPELDGSDRCFSVGIGYNDENRATGLEGYNNGQVIAPGDKNSYLTIDSIPTENENPIRKIEYFETKKRIEELNEFLYEKTLSVKQESFLGAYKKSPENIIDGSFVRINKIYGKTKKSDNLITPPLLFIDEEKSSNKINEDNQRIEIDGVPYYRGSDGSISVAGKASKSDRETEGFGGKLLLNEFLLLADYQYKFVFESSGGDSTACKFFLEYDGKLEELSTSNAISSSTLTLAKIYIKTSTTKNPASVRFYIGMYIYKTPWESTYYSHSYSVGFKGLKTNNFSSIKCYDPYNLVSIFETKKETYENIDYLYNSDGTIEISLNSGTVANKDIWVPIATGPVKYGSYIYVGGLDPLSNSSAGANGGTWFYSLKIQDEKGRQLSSSKNFSHDTYDNSTDIRDVNAKKFSLQLCVRAGASFIDRTGKKIKVKFFPMLNFSGLDKNKTFIYDETNRNNFKISQSKERILFDEEVKLGKWDYFENHMLVKQTETFAFGETDIEKFDFISHNDENITYGYYILDNGENSPFVSSSEEPISVNNIFSDVEPESNYGLSVSSSTYNDKKCILVAIKVKTTGAIYVDRYNFREILQNFRKNGNTLTVSYKLEKPIITDIGYKYYETYSGGEEFLIGSDLEYCDYNENLLDNEYYVIEKRRIIANEKNKL